MLEEEEEEPLDRETPPPASGPPSPFKDAGERQASCQPPPPPLEWDHTVDVGGSSAHEDDQDAEDAEDAAAFFGAPSGNGPPPHAPKYFLPLLCFFGHLDSRILLARSGPVQTILLSAHDGLRKAERPAGEKRKAFMSAARQICTSNTCHAASAVDSIGRGSAKAVVALQGPPNDRPPFHGVFRSDAGERRGGPPRSHLLAQDDAGAKSLQRRLSPAGLRKEAIRRRDAEVARARRLLMLRSRRQVKLMAECSGSIDRVKRVKSVLGDDRKDERPPLLPGLSGDAHVATGKRKAGLSERPFGNGVSQSTQRAFCRRRRFEKRLRAFSKRNRVEWNGEVLVAPLSDLLCHLAD